MALSQRRSRLVARLRSRKTREREGLVLVEGVRGVGAALDAGAGARFAVVSTRLSGTQAGAELLARLERAGVEVERVEDAELGALSDTEEAQGVLLVCGEPAGEPDAIARGGRYLVLDAVQDPGNVGTLVRAAVAFGLDGVVALEGTADPWGAKAVRASAGMAFRIPVLLVAADPALARLVEVAVPLLVADAAGGDPGEWSGRPGGFALAVGNEGSGVRDELRAAAAAEVGVPMAGGIDSLNAGVAGSLLLYLLTRGSGALD